MNIQEKRQLLDSSKGKFFSVVFIKADGSLREMNCKKWIDKAFTNGRANAQANTCAHKPEIYSAVCMDKKQFRNINLNKLVSAKVNGVEYTFIEGEAVA